MTTTELVPLGQRTLEELAAEANQSHTEVLEGLTAAIQSAVKAGEALLEAKHVWGNESGWSEWVANNIHMGASTAWRYMRLAEFQHLLPDYFNQPQLVDGSEKPTILKAVMYLKAAGATRERGRPRNVDYDEIRRLHQTGMSNNEIARFVGCAHGTVQFALLPASERKRLGRKRSQESRDARKALVKARNGAQIAAAKGDIADAYSLLRKCLQRAQTAHDSLPPWQAKRDMGAALGHLHRAEDAIARAVKNKDVSG